MLLPPSHLSPEEQVAYYRAIFKEIRNLVVLALVILAFYSSCYQPHRIPSGSMIPTLMVGDYILVDKSAYGFKIPFSDFKGAPIYLGETKPVERGDVIVFKYPKNKRINYIKRVVGLPGERISMNNHRVSINGVEFPMEPLAEMIEKENIEQRYFEKGLTQYKVMMDEKEHIIQMADEPLMDAYFTEKVLGEDEYFVVGDNRDFSSDSRDWGVVPFDDIKGRAMFVWFSLVSPFADEGPMRSKWSRVGKEIR